LKGTFSHISRKTAKYPFDRSVEVYEILLEWFKDFIDSDPERVGE
jgi:hypothetical protein